MKKKLILSCFLILLVFVSCTKTEGDSELTTPLAITLTANQTNLVTGNTVTFNVTSSLGDNLTTVSAFLVDGVAISGNSYTFTTSGTYLVKASYQSTLSNVLQIVVTNPPPIPQFVNRVLVEEYSGTWCGNCPKILYGTQLLKEQTDKEVSVQIHLFNNDPFITSQGNQIATNQGVSGVPTGKINRTINWNGPQYQNVNQVIGEIKPSSNAGVAINASLTNNTINATIKLGFSDTTIAAKLVVYLVEDNLFHTQANYSSNLYGGLSSIPNFEYDGVLRAVISSINGDAITVNGLTVDKNYTFTVPSNVSSSSNIKLVAFLIDSNSNSVINVREATIGVNQSLEMLN